MREGMAVPPFVLTGTRGGSRIFLSLLIGGKADRPILGQILFRGLVDDLTAGNVAAERVRLQIARTVDVRLQTFGRVFAAERLREDLVHRGIARDSPAVHVHVGVQIDDVTRQRGDSARVDFGLQLLGREVVRRLGVEVNAYAAFFVGVCDEVDVASSVVVGRTILRIGEVIDHARERIHRRYQHVGASRLPPIFVRRFVERRTPEPGATGPRRPSPLHALKCRWDGLHGGGNNCASRTASRCATRPPSCTCTSAPSTTSSAGRHGLSLNRLPELARALHVAELDLFNSPDESIPTR